MNTELIVGIVLVAPMTLIMLVAFGLLLFNAIRGNEDSRSTLILLMIGIAFGVGLPMIFGALL